MRAFVNNQLANVNFCLCVYVSLFFGNIIPQVDAKVNLNNQYKINLYILPYKLFVSMVKMLFGEYNTSKSEAKKSMVTDEDMSMRQKHS